MSITPIFIVQHKIHDPCSSHDEYVVLDPLCFKNIEGCISYFKKWIEAEIRWLEAEISGGWDDKKVCSLLNTLRTKKKITVDFYDQDSTDTFIIYEFTPE